MAPDDDEDLYDDEFDFVDDDDDDLDDADDESDLGDNEAEVPGSELEDEPAPSEAASRSGRPHDDGREDADAGGDLGDPHAGEAPLDEFGRPEPAPDYVVHIYEHRNFKRTIDRPFTGEDAEAFASEYNRTSKSYGRFAVAGKNDAKPRKTLD